MAIFARCHNVLIENCPIVTVRGCDRCHNSTPVWVICNCTIKASENRESEHNAWRGIPGCESRTDYLKIQKLHHLFLKQGWKFGDLYHTTTHRDKRWPRRRTHPSRRVPYWWKVHTLNGNWLVQSVPQERGQLWLLWLQTTHSKRAQYHGPASWNIQLRLCYSQENLLAEDSPRHWEREHAVPWFRIQWIFVCAINEQSAGC